MKPKKPTMDKIKKINRAIKKGATEKEIRDNFFYRSITKRDSFFENYNEYLSLDTSIIVSTPKKTSSKTKKTKVEKAKVSTPNEINELLKITPTLKDILPTLVEITEVYKAKGSIEALEGVEELTISEDRKRLSDVKYRSYGVSESVKAKLEVLYEKYPQYSKVALFNFLLEDSIDKYLD